MTTSSELWQEHLHQPELCTSVNELQMRFLRSQATGFDAFVNAEFS